MVEIIAIVIDIALGALAYRIARTVQRENVGIRAELSAVKEYLTNRFGVKWST